MCLGRCSAKPAQPMTGLLHIIGLCLNKSLVRKSNLNTQKQIKPRDYTTKACGEKYNVR